MLEPPALDPAVLIAGLQRDYGLQVIVLEFLPIGVDSAAAVYRAVDDAGAPYFVKLRRGPFDEIVVALPAYLRGQGIKEIVAPLPTLTGQLHVNMDAFTVVLYPFVAGRNGYEVALTPQQWAEFGVALRQLHTTRIPPTLRGRIPREQFSSRWGAEVVRHLDLVACTTFADPAAAELAAFLRSRRGEVLDLVGRASRYGDLLRARTLEYVVCHADIHAGNLLVAEGGALYIVDWDNPILAPRERDLMYIGGGQGFVGCSPEDEAVLFYRGYGPAEVDPVAVAYYRYARIVEDIAIFSTELLESEAGGADRAQSLRYLQSNFLPGGTIARAHAADHARA